MITTRIRKTQLTQVIEIKATLDKCLELALNFRYLLPKLRPILNVNLDKELDLKTA